MARPLGVTGRGLRLGIGRPGTAVVVPTSPSQPMLVTEAGDVIATESGDRIAVEQT
jgi:hypothetical protein